jgi:uncharacterized membrane protein
VATVRPAGTLPPYAVDMSVWSKHPAVRSDDQLTLGERAADRTRNGMGSWPFVITFLVFMAIWAFLNTGLHLLGTHGHHGFDPYPYILLNLMLSMVAGLQGAILLIAAKRADAIAAALAQHDYDTNLDADRIVKAVHALTLAIHQQVGCPPPAPEHADPLAAKPA